MAFNTLHFHSTFHPRVKCFNGSGYCAPISTGETEAQSGLVTCLRSLGKTVAESGQP